MDEIRAYFLDLLPANRFFVFSVFDKINFSNLANTWKRKVSEHIRGYSLALLRPDFVLNPSIIEGFDDDIVSSSFRNSVYENCVIAHDLIPFYDRHLYIGNDVASSWYLEKLRQLLDCDLIFSNSEYTEKCIVREFSAHNVCNISAASEYTLEKEDHNQNDDELLLRMGIHEGYLLYVGSLEPRKNPEIIVRAFSLLPETHKTKLKIVFVGKINLTDHERMQRLADDLGIDHKNKFVFTDFLSEPQLRALYRNCVIFIFPSFSEGFGLPVLEAMASGAVVLSSDRTSLPEVVGRSDLLFDPDNAVKLCDKILFVLEQPDYRAEIVAFGLARAREFSWDRTASRLIDNLEQRLSQRAARHPLIAASLPHFAYIRAVGSVSAVLDQYDVDEAGRTATGMLLQTNLDTATAHATSTALVRPTWRVEGPFNSSYSLALVNRETARALNRQGVDTSLFSTEGPGDFDPDPEFLSRTPDIARLHSRGRDADADAEFTVVSRLVYPPRVTRMNGAINLFHHYAWEEAGFPQQWLDDFNTGLNGLTCLSRHVQKVMIDHGIRLPTSVTGNGIDHWDRVRPNSNFRIQAKAYRFLHISSCLPRKGVDCLLTAYGKAFRRQEDVSLIIKTAPNPHNTVAEDLARLQAEDIDYPDVVLIDDDLSDAEINALYLQCHALVAPSRAEGFGLPAAEAMVHGLPVIATGWSGNLDFCSDETAWLVDFKFARARSHFNLPGSVWAEPSVDHLAAVMRQVRSAPRREIQRRTTAAIDTLRASFSWDHVAWRLQQYVADLISFADWQCPDMKVAWVTTWNIRCGVASYSKYLLENRTDVRIFAPFSDEREMYDEPNVTRNWTRSDGSLNRLLSDISTAACDVVVIQFNYAFFIFHELRTFIEELIKQGRIVIFVTHATHENDPDETKRLAIIAPLLARCSRVLVHSIADMNRLKDMGVVENVTLFPHPYPSHRSDLAASRRDRRRFGARRVIASYGFFLPHKGLIELIEAFALMSEAGFDGHLLLVNAEYPEPVSSDLIQRARELAVSLGVQDRVTLINDFLTDDESLANLREADLIVLPYQPSTGNSASGAARLCLVSGVPVAVTPLPVFDELEDAVLRLPGCSARDLAVGIAALVVELETHAPRVTAAVDRATGISSAASYERSSRRLFDMLYSLHLHHQFDVHRGQKTGPDIDFPRQRRQFRSQDGMLRTRVGCFDANGYIQSTGREGVLTFGPYIGITPGPHRLRGFGTSEGIEAGRAHLRVTSNQGEKVLHEVTLSWGVNPSSGCLLDTEFVIERAEDGVEFTLSVDAGLQICLQSYVLEYEDPASTVVFERAAEWTSA